MNMMKDAPNEALVEIGTHKIAVKIVGDVEDESELDTLLAEVREKALDGMGLNRKWKGRGRKRNSPPGGYFLNRSEWVPVRKRTRKLPVTR